MDAQTLLAKPKETPTVVAKVTTISPLVKVSTKTKKTSIALRKTFENGIYQRKTQLSVLNRYKKRLDSIQKENDNKYRKKQKQKPKGITLPKFKGTFFTAGASDDFLKSLGALAAFNSVDKLMQGDFLGALSPGMVAAAALLGPGLLGMAGDAFFNKGPKVRRGFDATGRRVSTGAQERYRSRYGDDSFKKRFGNDALKRSRQGGNAVQTATQGGRTAKAFGKFGASIIPGVGAVVGAADAAFRAQAGDQTGAAIAGTGAALDAFAAGSAATGIGLPLAGLASIASFALDLTNLTRDLLGVSAAEEEKNKNKNKDKLKTQTEKQKALVEGSGNLTFGKTLVSYEKALVKFERFALNFTGAVSTSDPYNEGAPMAAPNIPPGGAYDGPISGDTFMPLPGGDVGTQGRVSASQGFGASRDGGSRSHAGLDMTHWSGPLEAAVAAYKTGKVIKAANNGYRGVVEIDHGGGLVTRYVHVVPSVSVGQVVYGGQQIATLYPDGGNTHLHFEVYPDGKTPTDPLPVVRGVKNRISSPLSIERAKEGKNEGGISVGPKSGYFEFLHGTEAVIPLDNNFTASGGDPLKNVDVPLLQSILVKSKSYTMAMSELPPQTVQVPIPVMPPQIQYVSSGGSPSLNIQSDADKMLLKKLYYNSLG